MSSSSSSPKSSSSSSSSKSRLEIKWIQEENMLYELEEKKEISNNTSTQDVEDGGGWSTAGKKRSKKKKKIVSSSCRGCGKVESGTRSSSSGGEIAKKKFSICSKCGVSAYCSRDCQVLDWKRGHKKNCTQYAAIRTGKRIDHRLVLEKLIRKSHMYLNPFYIAKRKGKGPGFLYLNSKNTLEQLYLTVPVDMDGNPFVRSAICRFVTKNDFRSMVKQNFELAVIQKKLFDCNMNSKETVPIVIMLRCGVYVVLEITYFPSFVVCERMSGHHDKDEKLQFSLD